MKVLIADDHRLIVEGVKRALEEAPDFEVVGECSSGSQVLPAVGRTNPDIVLLDLRMPGADGLACLSRIRKQYPEVKVVVLSVSTDENVIQTVLKRGASAFIVKSINPIDLPSALRQAVDGTVYSAIGLPDPGDSAARAAGLTERETAILAALARGRSPRVPERARREPDRRPLSKPSSDLPLSSSEGVRTVPAPPPTSWSPGYRRSEDVGHAHPLGVAGLAGNRGEDQDPGLLHLQRLLDDALAVRGLGAEVELRALDPHVDALDRLAT